MKLTGGQVLELLKERGIEITSTTLNRWASSRIIPDPVGRSKTSKRRDGWPQETVRQAVVAYFFLKQKPPIGPEVAHRHLRAKTWPAGEVHVGRSLGLELLASGRRLKREINNWHSLDSLARGGPLESSLGSWHCSLAIAWMIALAKVQHRIPLDKAANFLATVEHGKVCLTPTEHTFGWPRKAKTKYPGEKKARGIDVIYFKDGDFDPPFRAPARRASAAERNR